MEDPGFIVHKMAELKLKLIHQCASSGLDYHRQLKALMNAYLIIKADYERGIDQMNNN
jgi:hypothetical protein